jgi:hypothetical protein
MSDINDNAIAEAVLLVEVERQLHILNTKFKDLEVRYNRVLDQRNQLHEIATDMWIYGIASPKSKGKWAETMDKFERLDNLLNELGD